MSAALEDYADISHHQQCPKVYRPYTALWLKYKDGHIKIPRTVKKTFYYPHLRPGSIYQNIPGIK